MTVRNSEGLEDFLDAGGTYLQAFEGGRLEIYSGTQPLAAYMLAPGTLLCTITDASGALTKEVRATGRVEFSGGGDLSSIDTLTVDGVSLIDAAVAWAGSTTFTATLVAQAINASVTAHGYWAYTSGSNVYFLAPFGEGAAANGLVVGVTVTSMGATPVNMAGGVTNVNGLEFQASGITAAKAAAQTWSGVNSASGTATWYRLCGPDTIPSSQAAGESAFPQIRQDGSLTESGGGGDQILSSVSLSSGVTTTISSWVIGMPLVLRAGMGSAPGTSAVTGAAGGNASAVGMAVGGSTARATPDAELPPSPSAEEVAAAAAAVAAAEAAAVLAAAQAEEERAAAAAALAAAQPPMPDATSLSYDLPDMPPLPPMPSLALAPPMPPMPPMPS